MSEPLFRVGNIIRYGDGATALMRVTSVSRNHGGFNIHRYYGEQFYGGSVGAYEYDCKRASPKDARDFNRERK